VIGTVVIVCSGLCIRYLSPGARVGHAVEKSALMTGTDDRPGGSANATGMFAVGTTGSSPSVSGSRPGTKSVTTCAIDRLFLTINHDGALSSASRYMRRSRRSLSVISRPLWKPRVSKAKEAELAWRSELSHTTSS